MEAKPSLFWCWAILQWKFESPHAGITDQLQKHGHAEHMGETCVTFAGKRRRECWDVTLAGSAEQLGKGGQSRAEQGQWRTQEMVSSSLSALSATQETAESL